MKESPSSLQGPQ